MEGAKLVLELVPLFRETPFQVISQGIAVGGQEPIKQTADRGSELTAAGTENLVQAWRKIGLVGADVPIPQAHAVRLCGQRVTFFALSKLCLGGPEFGHVANGSDQAQRLAVFAIYGFGALEHGADLAVRSDDAVLDFKLLSGETRNGVGLGNPAAIVGMDMLQ